MQAGKNQDLTPELLWRDRPDHAGLQINRANGRLYMVKVTPAVGPSYYLVDQQGDGNFVQRDTMGPAVRPPMWTVRSW